MDSGILNSVRADRWHAVEDEELGGWVITNSVHVFTNPIRDRAQILAHVADEYVARHIADAHNSSVGHQPNFMMDSFFAEGEITEQYLVFCVEYKWESYHRHFDDIEKAREYYNSLPDHSGRQLKVKYVWTSNLREVV